MLSASKLTFIVHSYFSPMLTPVQYFFNRTDVHYTATLKKSQQPTTTIDEPPNKRRRKQILQPRPELMFVIKFSTFRLFKPMIKLPIVFTLSFLFLYI